MSIWNFLSRFIFLFFTESRICFVHFLCCRRGHDDDFVRDRYILIRSVETRTSHISIRTIFVFMTSVLSSRATANSPAEMLHKIYAAYLHLWRNGRDRDICYIPRVAFWEDKSYA